jgi:hypothetical protein
MSLAAKDGRAVAADPTSNVTKWEAGTCLHVATASLPNSHWAIGTETLEMPESTTWISDETRIGPPLAVTGLMRNEPLADIIIR